MGEVKTGGKGYSWRVMGEVHGIVEVASVGVPSNGGRVVGVLFSGATADEVWPVVGMADGKVWMWWVCFWAACVCELV